VGARRQRGRDREQTETDDKRYSGLSYAAEVQAKENDEEKRIKRQANRMLSRHAEEAGLDSRHRKMLRQLEHQKSQRDRTADRAADRDLAARDKEIDAMLGSNTDCPGPGCMVAPKDPAVTEATRYASSRFAPQSY